MTFVMRVTKAGPSRGKQYVVIVTTTMILLV